MSGSKTAWPLPLLRYPRIDGFLRIDYPFGSSKERRGDIMSHG